MQENEFSWHECAFSALAVSVAILGVCGFQTVHVMPKPPDGALEEYWGQNPAILVRMGNVKVWFGS